MWIWYWFIMRTFVKVVSWVSQEGEQFVWSIRMSTFPRSLHIAICSGSYWDQRSCAVCSHDISNPFPWKPASTIVGNCLRSFSKHWLPLVKAERPCTYEQCITERLDPSCRICLSNRENMLNSSINNALSMMGGSLFPEFAVHWNVPCHTVQGEWCYPSPPPFYRVGDTVDPL